MYGFELKTDTTGHRYIAITRDGYVVQRLDYATETEAAALVDSWNRTNVQPEYSTFGY